MEYRQLLIDKFKDSGWYNLLKGFLLSEDFDKIIYYLKERWEKENEAFTPPLSKILRAFEECPFEDLKVVIIGQDPYFTAKVADGIAFSCSNVVKPQPSLRFILNAINKTVYNQEINPDDFPLDLKVWSNQGILLLNSALTTVVGKAGKHVDLWKPFICYLLDMLKDEDIIFVFLGSQASKYEPLVDSNKILKATHPAAAAYNKEKEWDSNDIFNKINQILKFKNKKEIVWLEKKQ